MQFCNISSQQVVVQKTPHLSINTYVHGPFVCSCESAWVGMPVNSQKRKKKGLGGPSVTEEEEEEEEGTTSLTASARRPLTIN